MNTSLQECLDDEYPDMIDLVTSDYNLTDEQIEYCLGVHVVMPKDVVYRLLNNAVNNDKPYSIIILAFGDWCIIDTNIGEEVARFTPQVIGYPFILMIGTKGQGVHSETDLIEKLNSVLI